MHIGLKTPVLRAWHFCYFFSEFRGVSIIRTFAKRLPVLLAGMSILAGCAPAPRQPAATGTAKPIDYGFTIPSSPDKPNSYFWNGTEYVGSKDFLDGVHRQMATAITAASIAAIKPADASAGTLDVILPQRLAEDFNLAEPAHSTNPKGFAEAADEMQQAEGIADQARVELLIRAGIFSTVAVGTDPLSPSGLDGNRFALWFGDQIWHLRYRHGDPQIFENTLDLALWTSRVKNAAIAARKQGGEPGDLLSAAFLAQKIRFTFRGKTYGNVDALSQDLNAFYRGEAGAIRPVVGRLGGKVKLVLSDRGPGLTFNVSGYPEATETMQRGFTVGKATLDSGRVEALQRAKLFDKLIVETTDVADLPLDDWDYVIWQPSTTPRVWRFRSSRNGGEVRDLKLGGRDANLEHWVEEVRDQLAHPETASLPAVK